jgi:hypothetical protein
MHSAQRVIGDAELSGIVEHDLDLACG